MEKLNNNVNQGLKMKSSIKVSQSQFMLSAVEVKTMRSILRQAQDDQETKLIFQPLIRINRCFLALVILGITVSNSFAGGPWVQQKGKGYYKLSEWWIVFDQHYTSAGLIDPNVTTGIYNTFLYTEYGLSDRLTGIVNASVFSRNYMNNLVSKTTGDVLVKGEGLNSIGDIDVELKYGLTKPGSSWTLAGSLTLGLPTGKKVGGELNNLQTGDGEFNQMMTLHAGRGLASIGNVASYISSYVGVNNRTQQFSEELRYGLEYGIGIADRKIWLVGRLIGIESLKNGATAENITSTSIFANNTEFTSFSAEAIVYVSEKVGLSASFASAFKGEIIAAAPSYSVGVFFDATK